jgi:hypothetical protein
MGVTSFFGPSDEMSHHELVMSDIYYRMPESLRPSANSLERFYKWTNAQREDSNDLTAAEGALELLLALNQEFTITDLKPSIDERDGEQTWLGIANTVFGPRTLSISGMFPRPSPRLVEERYHRIVLRGDTATVVVPLRITPPSMYARYLQVLR